LSDCSQLHEVEALLAGFALAHPRLRTVHLLADFNLSKPGFHAKVAQQLGELHVSASVDALRHRA
jgi:hypothetical protein